MNKEMVDHFNSIKDEVRSKLTMNAIEFLRIGLSVFHEQRTNLSSPIQVAMGNLSIAIELMLKTLIAHKNPILLFTSLPLELRAFFSCPEGLPKSFNWRRSAFELRSFSIDKVNTIGLNEAIAIFYLYFPDQKQKLQPYLKKLSNIRNLSIHALFPAFQRYDLEKVVYLSLCILDLLAEAEVFGIYRYIMSDKDREFLASYNEKRIERLKKKIDTAKQNAKDKEPESCSIGHDWELLVLACPICQSDGISSGYTECQSEEDRAFEPSDFLVFFAEAFKCDVCGLKLDEPEELTYVGMEIAYDRSNKLDMWYEEVEHTTVYDGSVIDSSEYMPDLSNFMPDPSEYGPDPSEYIP